MVPASVDPATVTYDGTGPIPYVYGDYADFRQPLYDVEQQLLRQRPDRQRRRAGRARSHHQPPDLRLRRVRPRPAAPRPTTTSASRAPCRTRSSRSGTRRSSSTATPTTSRPRSAGRRSTDGDRPRRRLRRHQLEPARGGVGRRWGWPSSPASSCSSRRRPPAATDHRILGGRMNTRRTVLRRIAGATASTGAVGSAVMLVVTIFGLSLRRGDAGGCRDGRHRRGRHARRRHARRAASR